MRKSFEAMRESNQSSLAPESGIRVFDEAEGRYFRVQITGKFTKEDYKLIGQATDRQLEENDGIRVLFELINLEGWTIGAAWEDLLLSLKHYSNFERIAIVGDRKWKGSLTPLSKLFTSAEVRFFSNLELADAQRWMKEASAVSTR